MNKKTTVPNAWDDDWESNIDKIGNSEKEVKFTKAERLAKHTESNKMIWKSAEESETFHFLAAHDNIPFKSEFRPVLKVLRREPAPVMIDQIDPITGITKLIPEDENDVETKNQISPEELRIKTQRERAAKQKRYDAARERILGTGSRSTSPGDASGIRSSTFEKSKSMKGNVGKKGNWRDNCYDDSKESSTKSKLTSTEETKSCKWDAREENRIIRAPRGPDASGKPGFNFVKRGGN